MQETGCIPPCRLETFHLSQANGVASIMNMSTFDLALSITAPRAKTEVKKEFKVSYVFGEVHYAKMLHFAAFRSTVMPL